MEKIKIVLKILANEGFKLKNLKLESNNGEFSNILWTDENEDEYSIFSSDISIDNGKVAWFQTSKNDKHLLKVFENEKMFRWIPETYNPFFGCLCLLIEWYKSSLIFIYQEKHKIYISSIKNETINYFSFHGEKIERKGNLISYETYMNQIEGKVRLIQIPELLEIEPIDKAKAETLNLIPVGLNRPDGFLALK